MPVEQSNGDLTAEFARSHATDALQLIYSANVLASQSITTAASHPLRNSSLHYIFWSKHHDEKCLVQEEN
jgi:hypothetical protein